jgi:hypothetical protein
MIIEVGGPAGATPFPASKIQFAFAESQAS